jgi:hypothetical protein
MAVTPGSGVTFQYRTATGGSTTSSSTPGPTAPYYVLVTRTGDTLTGYYSADGVNFTQQGSATVVMGSTVYVGLADTSRTTSLVNNTTFDTVYFTSGTAGLPPGWASQDVGAVGQAGNAGFDGAGTFYLGGAGADIGDPADGFRYAYQTLTGDGDLLARVASQDYTDDAAKAGVMIRASLAADAPQALMAVTPANGALFQYRTDPGGGSSTTAAPDQAAPLYVDIARAGTTVTGSYSTDLVNWTALGSVDIALGSTVYIGLAVTSHNDGVVGNAAFDTVTATGLIGPLAGTYNTLAIPDGLGLSLGAGTGITLNWNDVSGSTGYAVERSGDGATWAQIGTTAAGVTTYDDNNPAGSHRYYYRVSALDAAGQSAPSAVASQVNRPSAPFNVTVTSWTTTQLIVNWRDVSGDTGYRVERSTDGVNFTSVGTVGTNVTSFTNGGLSAGTRYYYRVIALSPLGDSPASAVASNTTRAGPPPPAPPGNGPSGEAPEDGVALVRLATASPVWDGRWMGPSDTAAAGPSVPSRAAAFFSSLAGAAGVPLDRYSAVPPPAGWTIDPSSRSTLADLDNVFRAMGADPEGSLPGRDAGLTDV